MLDPIVQAIRRIRYEHAERFDFDLDAIFEDLRSKERRSGRKIVSLKPRPVKPAVPRK
jgi:hypothetical protein